MSDLCPHIFARVADLAPLLGVSSIKDLPGCWEYEFGPWRFAVNGHRIEQAPTFAPSMKLPPFHLYIERGGMPMALVSPGGGIVLGEGGEDAAIAALEDEAERLKAVASHV